MPKHDEPKQYPAFNKSRNIVTRLIIDCLALRYYVPVAAHDLRNDFERIKKAK